MKRLMTIILTFAMCLCLFVGCSPSGNEEVTETTTVLYVENAGFIAKISGKICYVEYPNADVVVAVGDQVELTYMLSDHVIVINDQTLGGYQWDTVLVKFSRLTVK